MCENELEKCSIIIRITCIIIYLLVVGLYFVRLIADRWYKCSSFLAKGKIPSTY